MNIEKQVNRIIKTTINDLKNGKYKLISIGKYESKLKYGNNIIEIWIANEEYGCKINSKVYGIEFPEFDKETKSIIYKLATTPTKQMLRNTLIESNKEKKQKYLDYKESVIKVKQIQEQIKNFDI
ncbi:MAG: hypothetical protein ACOWWH_12685 [Eubacteriaceae bacterium]